MSTTGFLSSSKNQISESIALPSQWLDYPRQSTIIADRFIACKTPLDDRYREKIGVLQRWTCPMLIGSVQRSNKKLGLVISLTNTEQFYNGKVEFQEKDISHHNIPYRTENEMPSDEEVQCFIDTCNDFIRNHPDDIIAVHCIYGFNRTGFLICAFLCRELDMSIDYAILCFAETRKPGIYKQDYLNALVQKLGDESGTLSLAPVQPEWCLTNSEDRAELNERLIANGDNKRSCSNDTFDQSAKRFCEKSQMISVPEFAISSPKVVPIILESSRINIQQKCQHMCGSNRRGFPGRHPVCMHKENYEMILQSPYMVTWKSVGTRYMMFIEEEDKVYMLAPRNNVFAISDIKFPSDAECACHLKDTLIDGELVIDKVDGLDVPRFLINDIITYNGENVSTKPFSDRLSLITQSILNVRQKAIAKGIIMRTVEPFSIRNKDFYTLSKISKVLSSEFHATIPHEVEGLLFLPELDPYTSGESSRALKWKENETIDFRLRIGCDLPKMSVLRENKAELYVNDFSPAFAIMPYSPDLRQYDNKIISCLYRDRQWHFHRLRTDRSFPNSKETAFGIIAALEGHVTKQTLCDLIKHNVYHAGSPTTT